MLDHDVVGLDIAMHNTLRVAEVQSLQELKNVEADVKVGELGVKNLEVGIVDALKDQRGGLGLRIADNVEEGNDIGTSGQVLENLDLTLDLLFLDGLQDLNAALFVVDSVETFKDLRVLAASDLAYDLVVVLDTPLNLEIVIVPVFLLESLVDIRIHTCDASSWHCRVLLLSQSGGEGEESDKIREWVC